jgi:hypothetical protein
VEPRLDVTPYFKHRIVNDPRESQLLANLAVAIPDQEGELQPIQDLWGTAGAQQLLSNAVCHVGFPPGPGFLLLPLMLVLGPVLATQWLGAMIGGLGVAALDRLSAAWSEAMETDARPPGSPNMIAVLAGAGTLWIWIVPSGNTFLFAQTVGTTALTLALWAAWRRRPWLGGLLFGIAITSRPAMLLALPLLVGFAVRRSHISESVHAERSCRSSRRRSWIRAAPMMVGPMLLGLVTLALNEMRFGSPFEFGYRFMIVPPELRARLLEYGPISIAHLARNLHYVVLGIPQTVRDAAAEPVFPLLVSDPHGMGLFFVTPAFVAAFLAVTATDRRRRILLGLTWVSLVLTCLPGLLYYNTGWVQWGGRFLLDGWPMWLVLTALGLRRMPRTLAWVLVVLSVLSNAWATLLTTTGIWPACCF